ncbi:uncharacterized protein KQ657_003370 [Scheffersomyces spartinae]|uniref:WSC domain-containing protein n=1 Tax=Scheffersomyces spartinae TaxID=45513 RepID=A0A9P8AK93_9ASCO|nr:uncharacterized protein KQ657_003370 [Scheffersomyces spartinae]KAG7195603.1 hypothetical protein KQ657_003370 [Scheffersomyces spartinae]
METTIRSLLVLLLCAAAVNGATLGCYSKVSIASTPGSYMYQAESYCQEKCSDSQYFAISNGNFCVCLSSAPSSSDETSDSSCNVPCAGYGSQTCGGKNAYTVYSVSDSGAALSGSLSSSSSSLSSSSGASLSSKTSSSSKSLATKTSSDTSSQGTVAFTTTDAGGSASVIYVTTSITPPASATASTVTETSSATDKSSSSSTSSSSSSPSSDKSKKTNVGAIAGGVVGGVVGLGIIAGVAFFFWRRHNEDDDDDYLDENYIFEKNNGGSGNGNGATGLPIPMSHSNSKVIRGSSKKSRSSPFDTPLANPFAHPSDGASANEIPVTASDPRLNPSMLGRRRLSEGSLADETDYSRKVLQVANPE